MSVVVANMSTFGDARTRDHYGRNIYQAARAIDHLTPLTVGHSLYGITATDSVLHPANTQFSLVDMKAVEVAADGFAGRLDIAINSGAGVTADVTVAQLSAVEAKFVAATLSGDFGSSYKAAFTKGVGQDGVTAATTQSFSTGASGTAVSLAATSDNLYVKAARLDVGGKITVQGDEINFSQYDGTSIRKTTNGGQKYTYVHNAGTDGTSTGVNSFTLDPNNATGALMGTGSYSFNTYNAVGAVQPILSMGAGGADGAQLVNFTNSNIGINTPASASYKMALTGNTLTTGNANVTGNVVIGGDLNVTGTVTTVSSTQINVSDKGITLASNTPLPANFDGGGVSIGSDPAAAVHMLYRDNLKAFESNINYNLITGKSYFIGGAVDTSLGSGVSLSESLLQFGSSNASLLLGATDALLSKSGLNFGSNDAAINFGTQTTVDKNGITGSSDTFHMTFGSTKAWRIQIETVNSEQYLSMQFSTDGGVTYATKFSISP